MNIISHSYSHVITCFLFFFSTFRLSASALSRSSSAVHAGSCHAPSRSRAFALSQSSSAVHAGSCKAPSRSRAFALSKTRKIQFCLQAANLDFSCFWHCSMLTDIIPHWRYFLIAVYRFLFSYYFLFCIILLYQEVFYEF